MSDGAIVFIVTVGLIALLLAGFQFACVYPSEKTINITVKEKFTKMTTKLGQKYPQEDYLITDTKGDTYKCADDPWFIKFGSTDVYTKMEIGKTYTVKTCGWRTQILSEYPNIIEVE